MNVPSQYTLPTINFIGGSTQELECLVMTHNGSKPFDLAGCTAFFSLIDYANATSVPQIYKEMEIKANESGVCNSLSVKLGSSDTMSLTGKFIYQISIHGKLGSVDNRQGIMLISGNINQNCSI